MREIVNWLFAFVLLGSTASYVLRPVENRTAPIVETPALAPTAVQVPYTEPLPEPPAEDPRDWCEPVDPIPCLSSGACPSRADGTPRTCVREWWVPGSSERVCIAAVPSKKVQRWRAARLRVLVDEICKRHDGCNPVALHDYLAVLAKRESSWRPHAVHRLSGDVEANHVAWKRNAATYINSPAHDEPWRWQGYGYYGQNSAYLLAEWDATAVPEVLCGEVEATLVHLRTARERWRRLTAGVTCNGEPHHGTATGDGPSWYDVSLANSGSDPCPGISGHRLSVRQHFERSAESRGLDPYGRVTLRMLGRDVPRDEQDDFARHIRAEMDRLHPSP